MRKPPKARIKEINILYVTELKSKSKSRKEKYSKNPRIRTSTSKNLQPKIWGF